MAVSKEKAKAQSVPKKGFFRRVLRGGAVLLSLCITLLIVSQVLFWAGFGWLHTNSGQAWIQARVAPALAKSGYDIKIGKIGISIGSRLNIDSVTVGDAGGVIADARNITLGIDIPQLLTLHELDLSLSADEMTLRRSPEKKSAQEATEPAAFVWPQEYFTSVSLDKFSIKKLVLVPAVAGARMEAEIVATIGVKPAGDDILLDAAFDITSAFPGLPSQLAVSAAVTPATEQIQLTAVTASSPQYNVSGSGKLSADANAPLEAKLDVSSHFPMSGGQARAEGVLNISGTTAKPALAAKGIMRLPVATADFDTISITARMDAAGRGHIDARSSNDGKNAAISSDISYGNNRLKLGNLNINWPGISTRGSADLWLDGGFRSAQVSLSRLMAGDFSLNDIRAQMTQADGNIYKLSVQALSRNKRSLDASGTVGLGGGMPVNLTLKADRFDPFRNIDAVKGAFSGVLTAQGRNGDYKIAGTVKSARLDITIPDHFNAAIPKLNIVSRRRKAAANAPDTIKSVRLDITAVVERQVFVRGQGLDAEFGGKVAVTGTLDEPLYNGLLESRRGRYEAFGKRFDLTRARFRFEGPVPPSPYLDILAQAKAEAEAEAEDIVATIALTGSVSKPSIDLSSVPKLPPDEVLSRLLFGKELSKITPFQAIQVANALRQFSGGGGGLDPLSLLRRATGLDDLQVNTDASGATGVGAGKYITDKVYIEGVTGTDGKTGAAKVKIELTPNIKAESKVGPGQGSGAAIFWQKDY